jgi:hypothetical protein
MRDTKYATEIETVSDQHGQTIERIFVKEHQQEEIRFSWWKDGRLTPRPLDLPESDLLPLMREALKSGIFTPEFISGLRDAIEEATNAPRT